MSFIYSYRACGATNCGCIVSLRWLSAVCFIDDKTSLQGQSLSGLKEFFAEKGARCIRKFHIEEILLAMPSASRARKKSNYWVFWTSNVKIMELPGVTQLVGGRVQVSDIREVDIIDLLGRDQYRQS